MDATSVHFKYIASRNRINRTVLYSLENQSDLFLHLCIHSIFKEEKGEIEREREKRKKELL